METPTALANLDRDAAYYRLVEITLEDPIWLVDVTCLNAPNSRLEWRRKYFAHEIHTALTLLSLDTWRSRALYVLIPGCTTTSADRFRLGRCKRLWESQESEGEPSCWRVEFDDDEVVISLFDTPSDEEFNWMLVWQDPEAG